MRTHVVPATTHKPRQHIWAETMTEKPKGPQSQPPKQPPEEPEIGPTGPRTPYPVDEPPDSGSEPDYFPGKPAGGELPKI